MDKRIPVTVLTGFLGSGKTTLLNRLLQDPALKDTAVIINEFGEIGIDHLLVEQAEEGVIELSDGCLCCTMRGDLIDTLANLVDRLQTGRIEKLARIVIETTGLADPAPILQAVLAHPAMLQSFRIDGVLTLVDAVNGLATLRNHQEALKQVAFADRIVISKSDLATEKTELNHALRKINPFAGIVDGQGIDPAALIGSLSFDLSQKSPDVQNWLDAEMHHHHHDHHHDVNRHNTTIRAFSLVSQQPVSFAALEGFIDLMRGVYGERMLRMKGIVELKEDPARPIVIHGVQTLFHPPQRLEHWPSEPHETRLVLIVDGIEEAEIKRLFDAFLGVPSIDTADHSALSDNPLAIPGLKF